MAGVSLLEADMSRTNQPVSRGQAARIHEGHDETRRGLRQHLFVCLVPVLVVLGAFFEDEDKDDFRSS